MSNKKELKQQVRSDVTMLEELKQLRQDLVAYKQDCENMGVEILSLKRQNAGLKGLNKQLQKRVEHYKRLDLEGDELNEEKIAKIETLNEELKEIHKQLEKAENAYAKTRSEAMTTVKRKNEEIEKLKEKLVESLDENAKLRSILKKYEEMPWYKKVFRHK